MESLEEKRQNDVVMKKIEGTKKNLGENVYIVDYKCYNNAVQRQHGCYL